MASVTCPFAIPDAQCKPISDGGLCDQVSDATAFTLPTSYGNGTGNVEPLEAPNLAVPVPGLTFSTKPQVSGGQLEIPFMAQYLSAAYRFLAGVAVMAAAVMIVWGGFKYIAGSSMSSVASAKETIQDALIGLFLVFATYTILGTLNARLTNPASLKVSLISHQDASLNAKTETSAVQEAATAQPSPIVEVPTVAGEAPPAEQTPTVTTPEVTPPTPGKVVTNSQGGYVAQGKCPSDMLPIPYSPAYETKTKEHVASFCMDVFEAPNIRGQMPFTGVTDWEADWYCSAHGKRLCTTPEWVRACLGPKGENTYGYGPDFIKGLWVTAGKDENDPHWYATIKGGSKPGPCNYDTPAKGSPSWGKLAGYQSFKPEETILNPDNPKLNEKTHCKTYPNCQTYGDLRNTAIAEAQRLDGAEPSGSRPLCVTAEGIYDMPGNVTEYTVKKSFADKTTDQRVAVGPVTGGSKPYDWRGFYWAPITHKAATKATPTCTFSAGGPHAAGTGWRDYANGFRCCLDLDDSQNPAPNPE